VPPGDQKLLVATIVQALQQTSTWKWLERQVAKDEARGRHAERQAERPRPIEDDQVAHYGLNDQVALADDLAHQGDYGRYGEDQDDLFERGPDGGDVGEYPY
jgi:hypothetical protein